MYRLSFLGLFSPFQKESKFLNREPLLFNKIALLRIVFSWLYSEKTKKKTHCGYYNISTTQFVHSFIFSLSSILHATTNHKAKLGPFSRDNLPVIILLSYFVARFLSIKPQNLNLFLIFLM